MCGIGGILRTYPAGVVVPPREESIREEWLDILDDSIKHRGPDGCGRFRDRVVRADGTTVDVALIHRRMAIIDLEGGHQPMLLRPEEPSGARVGDQLAVVFNGCIYNHRELRKELERLGAEFRTDHSDTEVLLWGWRKWGRVLFEKLEGMFALAIWDREIAGCVLAVDNFAEKPLYKYEHPTPYAELELNPPTFSSFASTSPALERLLVVARQRCSLPHEGTHGTLLEGWLQFGWNHGTPTVVRQVDASSIVRFPRCEQDSYCIMREDDNVWGVALRSDKETLSPGSVDTLLRDSVHQRLEADVPIGVFLSGGLDSALITKYAAEVRPDIQAFTVRMPAASHDESHAAAATAKHLGVRHHILDCEANASEDLVREVERLGLPFADSSLLPSLWLCRTAAKHVKVALGGDGGDDLFMGYQRQLVARALNRVGKQPEALGGLMEALDVSGRLGSPRYSKAVRLLDAAAHEGYKDIVAIFPSSMYSKLSSDGGKSSVTRHFGMVPHGIDDTWFFIWQRRFDILFYLCMDLMRKADTASMAAPLELRSPFLDYKLAVAAMRASRDSLLLNGERKGLLRAVARKYFPSEIVDRPKMGFAIPLADWFRSDFGGLRSLLGDLVINAAEPFPAEIMGCELNRAFIRELFDQHMSGKRDHAQRLYALLVMAIWCRWYKRVQREGK
ncbi:MAG: asparagine synthase (glutamine-hydrolyzing) [Phycisphaerales bacterium]